jgi:phage-related baseplate assembly protein
MLTLSDLLTRETRASIYAKGLSIATSLGLPVTSWTAGDPTRSLYHFASEVLETLETVAYAYVGSAFLDFSEGAWLTLLARQVYNVDRVEATVASCQVRLTNAKGGVYTFGIGDVRVKSSTSGATYRNTSGGTLTSGPGSTLTLDFEADVAGSDSSSGLAEIDEMVTVYPGVTAENITVAVGIDEESDQALRERCRDKLGSLSPNGPRDAYSFVALSPMLTGTTEVTRSRVYPDSDTGDVLQYIAGASGAVGSGVVSAVTDAIVRWATPWCVTPTVLSATAVPVDVTAAVWVYAEDGREAEDIEDAAETLLEQMIARRPIGGDIIPPATTGALYMSLIKATIRGVSEYAFRVDLSAPAANVALTNGQVATLGAVTITVNVVDNP